MKLGTGTEINLGKLIESRAIVQANSGGGKSWVMRRIIEQFFGKVQIIIIDPEGEFSNLREKYDFVYAGKDGDCPAEPRSAQLLAHRLLELKASAIIDLYELKPQERKHFVKIFCDALVNAPKDLWHDVLIPIDEAHVFAPEKGEAESLMSIIDLCSLGRKRGFCPILATQRISKLHKDAAAECNNKLIGRASLDIDMKRSADELGFTSREQTLSLRTLEPGEFYVFGPAISNEVKKTKIGDVIVKPPKRGVSKKAPPAPTENVKKILSKLADLPKEAEKKLQTEKELHKEIAQLKQDLARRAVLVTKESKKEVRPVIDEKAIKIAIAARDKDWSERLKQANAMATHAARGLRKIEQILKEVSQFPIHEIFSPDNLTTRAIVTTGDALKVIDHIKKQIPPDSVPTLLVVDPVVLPMGSGEMKVLSAIAMNEYQGITREHITVFTGYKTSTRNTYIQRLQQRGYVRLDQGRIFATPEGIRALGPGFTPLPTGQELIDHLMRTLPEGERSVLKVLIDASGAPVSRDQISEMTGYKTSTRNTYLQRLSSRELVENHSDGVSAAKVLFV